MLRIVLIALALWLLLWAAMSYAAAPLKFCSVCDGRQFTISKRGDGAVLIRCKGDPWDRPWLVILKCGNPSAKWVGNDLAITCVG